MDFCSVSAQKTREALNAIDKQRNALVIEALARRSGVKNANPYDFLNRMSRRDEQGGITVFLDSIPLLWLGHHFMEPTETGFDLKFNYKIYDEN